MYLGLLVIKCINMSEKISSAANQQGSRANLLTANRDLETTILLDPSETTRRAPALLQKERDEDIVHAL